MAYGIYYRRKGERTFKRAREWVEPTRTVKFVSVCGRIPRDIRCATIEEAKAIEAQYAAKGLETKIKEVK